MYFVLLYSYLVFSCSTRLLVFVGLFPTEFIDVLFAYFDSFAIILNLPGTVQEVHFIWGEGAVLGRISGCFWTDSRVPF